jgi:organic radical activating enzyme
MTDELQKWRDENLNSVSCTFCAAKWYNASLHLGHGYTNSCHLPLPHPIDLEEIKTNPSALHNTKIKKEARKMMLEGKRPAECSYCWKIEDIGRNNVSDRVFKSKIYSEEDIKKLKDLPWDADVMLKTVEISFDRTCNFACSYCNAGYSTTWGKDIQNNGPYQKFKTSSAGAYQSDGSWAEKYGKDSDNNPYVTAFLEWWPELSQHLQEIRVTGGEPSQSHNFWDFIETMKQYPSKNLRLAVNSNLGVNEKSIQRLIDATHELDIKEFDLYTSCEAFGEQAEYIRDGLNYQQWRANLVNFLENANPKTFRALTIMMTINSLCLFSIIDFLEDMKLLKAKYGHHRPNLDLNILRWPAFMSPLALPDDVKIKLRSDLVKWYDENKDSDLFVQGEKAQLERLIDYLDVVQKGHTTTENDKELLFHDFKSFYEQYDIRRNKDFRKTLPELVDWYNTIEVDQTIRNVRGSSGKLSNWEIGEYISDIQQQY